MVLRRASLGDERQLAFGSQMRMKSMNLPKTGEYRALKDGGALGRGIFFESSDKRISAADIIGTKDIGGRNVR